MPTSAERKGLNEAAFREANERLEQGARDLVDAGPGRLVPFLCECPQERCTQVVLATLAEYERIRGAPKGGLAAPGHEDLTIERVIERNERLVVTEKFGRAGEVHLETDPRRE